MAKKRPKLSRDAVLNYVFHPRTAPKPLGIRKSLVTSTKWKTSRKSSWNKMDADKQQAIIAAGQQNSYLTGKTNLADAKRALRPTAIAKGIARPTRTDTNRGVANHLLAIATGRPESAKYRSRPNSKGVTLEKSAPNKKSIYDRVKGMNAEQKRTAMGLGSYDELVDAATDDNLIDEDGINPFWYH